MQTLNRIHIFEKADLGIAPFILVDVEMHEQGQDGKRTGTACDYCGTYITNVFHCKSSDGKRFVIGSTCVDKLGDAGLTKAINAKVSDHRRALRWAKESAKREIIRLDFERVRPMLETMPHPNEYLASKGKTLLDYVEYCGIYGMTSQSIIKRIQE